MSAAEIPTGLPSGPAREPACAVDLRCVSLSGDACPAFDFRSDRFGADARTLARVTGVSLDTCRQQLFLAEGDMALACTWLIWGYQLDTDDPTLH